MRDQTKVFLLCIMTVILIGCGCYTVSMASEKVQREELKTVKAEATAQIASAITAKSQQEDRGIESGETKQDTFDLKHLALVEERTEAQINDDVANEVPELPEVEGTGENDPAESAPDRAAGSEAEVPAVESAGGDADPGIAGSGTEGYWEPQEEVIDYDMEEPRGVDGGDAEEYGAEEWTDDAEQDSADPETDSADYGTEGDSGSTETYEPEPEYIEPEYVPDDTGDGSLDADGVPEQETLAEGSTGEYVEEPVEDSGEQWEYVGVWTVTGFCGCIECCGQWAGSPTASGAWPTAGWTCASDLPFGTLLYIDGIGYRCVEDRGVGGAWVDIYYDSHQEALNNGMFSADVWIVR